MKTATAALVIAAIAVPGHAHPVQSANDYKNGHCISLRQEHDGFAQALKAGKMDASWLTSEIARIEQEMKAVPCPVGADLFNPLKRREEQPDWNDPSTYPGVDWNDPKNYQGVDWSDPKNYEGVDFNSPELYKDVDFNAILQGTPSAPKPSSTATPVASPTATPSQADGGDESAECHRLGSILYATMRLGKACESQSGHCTQYVGRVNSLESKMKEAGCDINKYASKAENEQMPQNQHNGTVSVTSPRNVSCSMLTLRLRTMKEGREQCTSNCEGMDTGISNTTDLLKNLDCENANEPANPLHRRATNLDAMTKAAKNAYEAWESGLGWPAASDHINSAQKGQLCHDLHSTYLNCMALKLGFLMHGGPNAIPSFLNKWQSDIAGRQSQYGCAKENPIPLKARGPTKETTAKQLEITLPPNEARPDQKKLVCDNLRKEQLEAYAEMSHAYLTGGKPTQAMKDKMQSIITSQQKWSCGPYPAQPLKARSVSGVEGLEKRQDNEDGYDWLLDNVNKLASVDIEIIH